MIKELISKLFNKLFNTEDDAEVMDIDYEKCSSDSRSWKELYEAEKENNENILSANGKLIFRLRELEKIIEEEKKKYKNLELSVRIDFERQEKKISKEYEKALEDSEEEIRRLNDELRELYDLNCRLLRVSRERANSDRGIKNKKTHDGYLIVRGQNIRWTIDEEYGQDMTAYQYTIQTPYKIELPYDSTSLQVSKDLEFGHLLSDLGCTGIGLSNTDSGCCLIEWGLSVNGVQGYYEINAVFSKAITISDDRVIPKNLKKNK